jgi:hypothetical protein
MAIRFLLFYNQFLVVAGDVDAFELVERIDDVVYGYFFVPCEVEADMFTGLCFIDDLTLVESCNLVQDGYQLGIFIDNGLHRRTVSRRLGVG